MVGSHDGSKAFMAPETKNPQFRPQPLDVWAFGVTIYSVVYGRLPDEKIEFPESVSPACRDLLKALLTPCSEKRPTIEEAIQDFEWLHVQPGFEIEYPQQN